MSGTDTTSDSVRSAPAPVTAPAPRWRRRAWRVARSIVLIYLGVAIVLYALQNWMIFPGHSTQGQLDARILPGRDYELVELTTSAGDRITAVFGKAMDGRGQVLSDASSRPTLLFFYGNGMCAAYFMSEMRDLRKLGANVMVPDYAGYGMSGGKPSEASFYATANACWDHLVSRRDIDHTRIVPVGWSIGAAVAIDLAVRKPVAGLVTISAFTSMCDMGRCVVPWLPTSMLLKHRFESEQKIRNIRVPTLIIHGRGDRIIPFDMSQRLARASGGKVTTLWLDTDHTDLFALGGEEIYPTLQQFLRELEPAR